MLKSLLREVTLTIQSKNGASVAGFVWIAIIVFASLAAFVFLCIAAYDWLSLRYDSVTAGLIMAGLFAVLAIFAGIIAALMRRRVRERAILARAAKAHAPSWLLDPRILNAAVQAGRSFGWQRIVPVVILGFMAAQWARDSRDKGQQDL
jgi:hypothetical protein